jgi:hypothetical protein|tara:strand:- start:9655 stop:10419 length:765 start_codon:yes stop_codon:yes gene_type:complete
MKKLALSGLGVIALLLLANPLLVAQAPKTPIEKTQQAVSDYVFSRQQIAQTKNEWKVYKEVSERRIEFFESEIEALKAQIETAENTVSSAQMTISTKQDEIAALRKANKVVLDFAPEYEARIRALSKTLPAPLSKKLSALTDQLGKPKQAAQRMAIVIGILNEIDKFNSEWTIDGEQIGKTTVNVLYMGLSMGFYADENGTVGGLIIPTADGWERRENNALAPAISTLIKFRLGEVKPATFTPLPIEITEITSR